MRALLLIKTLAAAIVAVAITFTQAHNPIIGLIGVMAFTTVYIAVQLYSVFRSEDRVLRGTVIRIGISMVVLGGLINTTNFTKSDDYLSLVVNVLLATYSFAAIELFSAARTGFVKTADGRDHVIVGAVNVLMFVVYLLDATKVIHLGEIPAVGIYGAYAAILSVLWGIKAFD